MAERGNEKMTEWLDIKLDTLSSEERINLIKEIFATLTPQNFLPSAIWQRRLDKASLRKQKRHFWRR